MLNNFLYITLAEFSGYADIGCSFHVNFAAFLLKCIILLYNDMLLISCP